MYIACLSWKEKCFACKFLNKHGCCGHPIALSFIPRPKLVRCTCLLLLEILRRSRQDRAVLMQINFLQHVSMAIEMVGVKGNVVILKWIPNRGGRLI